MVHKIELNILSFGCFEKYSFYKKIRSIFSDFSKCQKVLNHPMPKTFPYKIRKNRFLNFTIFPSQRAKLRLFLQLLGVQSFILKKYKENHCHISSFEFVNGSADNFIPEAISITAFLIKMASKMELITISRIF